MFRLHASRTQTHLISVSLISDSLRKEGELFEYLTDITE